MAITCLGGGTAASLLTWPKPPLRNAWPPDETLVIAAATAPASDTSVSSCRADGARDALGHHHDSPGQLPRLETIAGVQPGAKGEVSGRGCAPVAGADGPTDSGLHYLLRQRAAASTARQQGGASFGRCRRLGRLVQWARDRPVRACPHCASRAR